MFRYAPPICLIIELVFLIVLGLFVDLNFSEVAVLVPKNCSTSMNAWALWKRKFVQLDVFHILIELEGLQIELVF